MEKKATIIEENKSLKDRLEKMEKMLEMLSQNKPSELVVENTIVVDDVDLSEVIEIPMTKQIK